jgi:putative transposase
MADIFKRGYLIRDQHGVYFMTLTVVGWIDVFSRRVYKDMLIQSLKYCQANKGLNLHAYVIMSNHVHLVVSVNEGHNLSDFVRDFKKFTAKSVIDYIQTGAESRAEWMLHQFKYYASRHTRNEVHQIWTHENHVVELFSPAFTKQKIDYIHDNPVRAGYVYDAADYIYSSASNYVEAESIIVVDCIYCL